MSHLPHACGVYLMRDAAAQILYIGKAKDLAKRLAQHFQARNTDVKHALFIPLVRRVDYVACRSENEALLLEERLVKKHRPFFNSALKDDKAYPFVKVTMGEDFPRVGLSRRKDKDGGAYFGPFPNVGPIKRLLSYLWRQRQFPLRPCRWDFGFERPLDPRKINSCLYYHTGDCPAPCAGLISYEDYREIALRMVLFLKGDYAGLAEELAGEMKKASGRMDYERAALYRDQMRALSQIQERVRFFALKPEDISEGLALSESVTDLKLALNLSAPPFHIECFDISHFQGHQTVASMVCFKGGEPNRAHYRRFKIKQVAGIDDFASMQEVVGRRCRRAAKEGTLPDLILIDGGKGQLKSALAALKEQSLRVPAAALAKRIEEVFIPGRSESIILERSRPALRLLQRARDEAHRFAITYHRLLRSKALFGHVAGEGAHVEHRHEHRDDN
jgi:excinuclease ABC subunit C